MVGRGANWSTATIALKTKKLISDSSMAELNRIRTQILGFFFIAYVVTYNQAHAFPHTYLT